jgi:hypothetical protein
MLQGRHIFNRTEPTADRQQAIDDLISSNVIGLALSETLDVERALTRNRTCYGDQNLTQRRVEVRRSGTVLESVFFGDFDKNGGREEPTYKNYALIGNSDSNNTLFVSGKELFSREDAADYYSSQQAAAQFEASRFGSAARHKLEFLMSSESFSVRMEKSAAGDLMSSLSRGVARHIFNAGSVFYLQKTLAELRRDGYEKSLRGLETPLLNYLSQHRFDRTIVANFETGIRSYPVVERTLEEILKSGLTKNVDGMLGVIAAEMHNPYDSSFQLAEELVANCAVHSIHPRTLQEIRRQNSAILVSDQLLQLPLHADPQYRLVGAAVSEELSHLDGDLFIYRSICASSPNLDYKHLGMVLRHEAGHLLDYIHPDGMLTSCYSYERLNFSIQSDWRTLKSVFKFIENFDLPCTDADLESMEFLGKLRRLPKQICDDPIALRTELFSDMVFIMQLVDTTFGLNPKNVPAYVDPLERLNEIPAIIGELQGLFGTAFIQELMPLLSGLSRRHRCQGFVRPSYPAASAALV